MSDEKYDFIVVGAGIVGVATAYYLKKFMPDKSVILIDKMSYAGEGDTSKSTQNFRNFYSNYIDFIMADSSADFYIDLQNKKGVDLHLQKSGYLWLLNESQFKASQSMFERMEKMGIDLRIYDDSELSELLGMNTKVSTDEEAKMLGLLDVDKGVLVTKAGHLSANLLVEYYLKSFLDLGGLVKFNTYVKSLLLEPKIKIGISNETFVWQDVKVTGVVTDNGVLYGNTVVLCVGVWVDRLLDPLGIESYQKVVKRAHFIVRARTEPLKKLLYSEGFNPGEHLPTILLPNPQLLITPDYYEHSFWLLYPHHKGIKYGAEENPEIHESYYVYGMYPIVTKYFPQFKDVRPDYSQACHRVIMPNNVESRLIMEDGLLVVTSTHGIIQGDALGRIAASALAGKEMVELYGGKYLQVRDLIYQSPWLYSFSPDHHV